LAWKVEQAQRRRAREERIRRDPERERELSRQRNIRYRQRLKENSERYKVYLEDARIRGMLLRERKGIPTNGGRRVVVVQARRSIPLAPLAYAVAQAVALEDEAMFAERAGVSARLLRAWRNHERDVAHEETADKVLIALDKFWWEVFEPVDAPGVFSPVRARDVTAWLEAALTAVEVWGDDGC
jgi:hypothetical protein